MSHIKKRPRKIAQLRNELIELLRWSDYLFSEFIEASALASVHIWHKIEREYKIPCPTCPKKKR